MLHSLAAIVLVSSSLAGASERVVWQIGQPDGSYREFAIAGDHASYQDRFPTRSPVFTVGSSEAAQQPA